MAWTDERIRQLRKYHAEGLSFAEIGLRISKTRNACIGKATRIGLPPRNDEVRYNGNHQPKKRKKKPNGHVRVARKKRRVAFRQIPPAPPVSSHNEKAMTAFDPGPAHRLPFEALTATTCRWPFGDPGESDFGFCGALCDVTETYCSTHQQLAYAGTSKRTGNPVDYRKTARGRFAFLREGLA